METQTKMIPSANSTGDLYVSGHLAPLRNEVTAFDLEVIGKIPEELNGRFTRMGPSPVEEPDTLWLKGHHWFAGAGMAHGLRLRDGKAEWFRSRRIVDRNVAKLRGYAPIPGPGEGERDGPVNTNLIVIGGKLCATIEAVNLPVELDYELESVKRTDFGGTLEGGFSGHTKADPITGEQHAITYGPGQPVRYISIDPEGRAVTKAVFDLPHIPMIHDMAFTGSFIVVPDFPVTFQPRNSHTSFPWLWDEGRPSRIGLMPRDGDGSQVQWFEAPRCYAFHFANAYDDGDLTIIDLPKHPSMFRTDQNGPNEGGPVLVRWTLDRNTGSISETVMDDRGNDFPRMNDKLAGQDYRYLYTAHWGDSVQFGPAMKHDLERGTTEVHNYGEGGITTEPVFVAKPDAKSEDDGWIISSVYDPATRRSDIVILEARDFTGDPIATIKLPTRIPFTFHGGWTADNDVSDHPAQ